MLTSVPIRPLIELAFDPVLIVADRGVRVETVLIAIAVLVGLLLAVRVASVVAIDPRLPHRYVDAATGEPNHLRPDDLLYLVVAAAPGAVIGGRVGYVLLHLDYYRANPLAMFDPGQGALTLPLAILGGALTAAMVARLLDTPIARWSHALALPLLFVLGAAKVALVAGGDGQGLPADLPWATAYLGAGPWGSLAPAIPSHPAQLYEGLLVFALLAGLTALVVAGAFERRDGGLFLLALAGWAAVRFVVAFAWRDASVLGPLRADQLLSLLIGVGAVILLLRRTAPDAIDRPVIAERIALASGRQPDQPPAWPDPADRPRF